jgi:hypothetical protein
MTLPTAPVLADAPFPTFGWEWTNPLAYFNVAGFALAVLILVRLKGRRGESGLADGIWWATLILAIGTGLHFLGDLTAVPESLDHQFIHFVVLCALATLFVFTRHGD